MGLLYGLIVRLLIELDNSGSDFNLSIAFLFVTPAVMGAITVYQGTKDQLKSVMFVIGAPWISIAAFLLLVLVIELEAVVCVVMMLPAFMLSGSLGGIIGSAWKSKRKEGAKNKVSNLILLLPILVVTTETGIKNPTETNTVTTSVLISAHKEVVWKNLKSVSSIKSHELQWSFAHFIGIPKPISSTLTEERVGGIRKIIWDKGIKFNEVITTFTPEETLQYIVIIDTIPPNAIDHHIKIGGKFFSVTNGGYSLESVAQNSDQQEEKVLLKLSCTYSISTKFNWYSKFWANWILDDFQEVILAVIKNRAEAQL